MSKAQELRENVARAIWNVMREYEDRCDMELEDMGEKHHVWEIAEAAIAASSEQQAAQQDDRIVKLEQAYKELSWMFHDQIVAQQAAWIEWQHGGGAEAGMQWIENGLRGPGHIPDEDEPYGKEAQAWYDLNNSDPFPVCQCGRPSNMMWMGQGFCCQAHSDAARASNGGTNAS